ncbi:MAG: Xaa-Pro peptidase family protein [Actinobacteria bacterium]|nr:Xaa-Pro peptidase family protein [Actinomycetota bacterium]
MRGARRDRLRARFEDVEVDALVVTDLVNVRYLTGFTGSNGRLVVGPSADADVLITDGRYETQAAAEVGELRVVVVSSRGVVDETVEAVQSVQRCGFEAGTLPWQAAEDLRESLAEEEVEAVAVEDEVEELRQVKDEAEIATLRAACAVTVDALTATLERVDVGITERRFALWLEAAMLERGAEDRAFHTIVASGPNSAIPHHRAGERPFAKGDLVKVDFGARLDGYHADCTRTFALGDPLPELVDVHAIVVRAQAAAVAAVVDGVESKAVDAACRDIIEEAGYGERFVHGTGHGVGLAIHEAPLLGSEATGTLRRGMTITVEPGIYLPGLGGVRIEDTVVVADDGPPEVLTATPPDLPRDLLVL